MGKNKSQPSLKGGSGAMLLIIIVAGILAWIWMFSGDGEKSPVENAWRSADSVGIEVTNTTVKEVGGKYRWFYDIRNEGENPFSGEVRIEVINGLGESVYDRTFMVTDPIYPGVGKSVYFDTSTGPSSIHGEYGVENFRYQIR